jgi:hypothetical protein
MSLTKFQVYVDQPRKSLATGSNAYLGAEPKNRARPAEVLVITHIKKIGN